MRDLKVDSFGIPLFEETISGRDLLNLYYQMTPDNQGSDRVERILKEVGQWELKNVQLSDLPDLSQTVQGKASQKLIQKYAQKKSKMPPVILDVFMDEYEVVDGFHRIEAARLRGDETIEAYVPAESNSESPSSR